MAPQRGVVIGADTHLDTIHLAALDSVGKPLADAEFRTCPRGYAAAVAWATWWCNTDSGYPLHKPQLAHKSVAAQPWPIPALIRAPLLSPDGCGAVTWTSTPLNEWASALFWLGFSLLLAHELDAVRAREWRLLFVLRRMPETRAQNAFVVAHVPLVAALLWLLTSPSPEVRLYSQIASDLFLIVHAGLHWRLRKHPLYDFHSGISRALIFGAAAVGAAHLSILVLAGR